MAQLEPCPLCGKNKWIGLKCKCVGRQSREAHRKRRLLRNKALRPVILMGGSIAVWTTVLVALGNAAAESTGGPVFRLIVPGLASMVGGWIRWDQDWRRGVDVWRMFWWRFPFDWRAKWESFRNMWLTMHRPIFKGFCIAAAIAMLIGFLRLPRLHKAVESMKAKTAVLQPDLPLRHWPACASLTDRAPRGFRMNRHGA